MFALPDYLEQSVNSSVCSGRKKSKCNRTVTPSAPSTASSRTTRSLSRPPTSRPTFRTSTRTWATSSSFAEATSGFRAGGAGRGKTVGTASGRARRCRCWAVDRPRDKIWQGWSGCTCQRSYSGWTSRWKFSTRGAGRRGGGRCPRTCCPREILKPWKIKL